MNENSTKENSKLRLTGAKNKAKKTTRDKIFKAAVKVFSEHSYKEVNIRMIATEAKVYHPLILYHFGSKAELFKAVIEEIYATSQRLDPTLFEGLGNYPIPDAVKEFLNRLIDFFFVNSESQKIMFLNLAHNWKTEEIPGKDYGGKHIKQIQRIIEALITENNIKFKGSEKDMRTIIHLFRIIMSVLIGGSGLHATAMKMEPDSDEYKDWVKKSLQSLFLPWLDRLAEYPDKPEKDN
jgi:AcrR family transcriptional regulator